MYINCIQNIRAKLGMQMVGIAMESIVEVIARVWHATTETR